MNVLLLVWILSPTNLLSPTSMTNLLQDIMGMALHAPLTSYKVIYTLPMMTIKKGKGLYSESYISHSPALQLSASVAVVAFCLWNNKLLRRYIELSLWLLSTIHSYTKRLHLKVTFSDNFFLTSNKMRYNNETCNPFELKWLLLRFLRSNKAPE